MVTAVACYSQVAYPLLTLLTCLEDDSHFKRNIEVQTEQMSRQLRVSSLIVAPLQIKAVYCRFLMHKDRR